MFENNLVFWFLKLITK